MGNQQMAKLIIRTDMNSKIATGHMMRCLSIADAAVKEKMQVIIVSADENGRGLVEERGFTYISLGTQWNKLEEELPEFEKVILQHQPDYALVDSYYVSRKYMKELRKLVKIAYIDDWCNEIYSCDTLICYANYYKKYNLIERYAEQTQLLLGCDYAPLRKIFSEVEKCKINHSVKEVLLLSGGADPYHFLKNFLNVWNERADVRKEIRLSVVCGVYNMDYKEVVDKYAWDEQIEIVTNVANIEIYMRKADVAISAAGTSLYELCACGTPTICYTLADNQLENAKSFHEDEIMIYAGDARDSELAKNIIDIAEQLMLDCDKRKKMSEKMMSLVDGQGARRIVSKLKG